MNRSFHWCYNPKPFLGCPLFLEIMACYLPLFIFFICTIPFSSCSAQISRKELGKTEVKQENVAYPLIQDGRVDPSRVVQLSWRPRIFVYRGFISDEECDHLVSLARDKEGGTQESAKSTSMYDVNDEVVARIEAKMSAWALLPQENGRPLQVVHYGHEEANQHYDYFGNKSAWDVGEPLMATLILYLSNVSRGGVISFPNSQLKASGVKGKVWPFSDDHSNLLKPIKGNAILVFNVHLNASPDQSSHHVRHPVEGEMWCATKFFHIRPVAVGGKNVSSESENSDCTDEDDNCPRWAAIGECQRNSVFMVGSPDYYGTCRKSCNVC